MNAPIINDPKSVKKPEYITDFGSVNVEPFLKALKLFDEKDWEIENSKKPNRPGNFKTVHRFECLDETDHIVFIWLKNLHDLNTVYNLPVWDRVSSFLYPEMVKICSGLYDISNVGFSKVVFARLHANSTLGTHVDDCKANYFTHKVHIPLKTNPNVIFNIFGSSYGGEDKGFNMQFGNVYEPNNLVPHNVVNDSEESRIHFIMECFDKDLFL